MRIERRGRYSDMAEERCKHCMRPLDTQDITHEEVTMGQDTEYPGEPAELQAVTCPNCGTVTLILYRVGP